MRSSKTGGRMVEKTQGQGQADGGGGRAKLDCVLFHILLCFRHLPACFLHVCICPPSPFPICLRTCLPASSRANPTTSPPCTSWTSNASGRWQQVTSSGAEAAGQGRGDGGQVGKGTGCGVQGARGGTHSRSRQGARKGAEKARRAACMQCQKR